MTPHQIFSTNSGEPEAREKRLKPRTADLIYYADYLCGRYFETSSREWICANCHLGICFVSLDCIYRAFDRAEPLTGHNALLNEKVILLDDVVHVGCRPA